MNTVAEIKTVVENLTPQEQHELAVGLDERQALLNSSAARFRRYDEEENERAPRPVRRGD